MVFALAVGLINGILVVRVGIDSLIATLGMQYICKGIVNVVSKGNSYYPFPDSFNALGKGNLLGIPYSVYIAAAVLLVCIYILRKTVFGRSVFALGGNSEAARLAGLNVKKLRMILYCIVALLAGFVGILTAARMGTSSATAGDGMELLIIAGVIIGGASLRGGVGSLWGTLFGVSLMEVLKNALVMLHITAYWQNVLIGTLMIVAVSLDCIRNRKNR